MMPLQDSEQSKRFEKVRGVYYNQQSKKWVAIYFKDNKKKLRIECDTREEAIKQRQAAEKLYPRNKEMLTQKFNVNMNKTSYVDLTGKTFGDYTVTDLTSYRKNRSRVWACQCNYCGAFGYYTTTELQSKGNTMRCKECGKDRPITIKEKRARLNCSAPASLTPEEIEIVNKYCVLSKRQSLKTKKSKGSTGMPGVSRVYGYNNVLRYRVQLSIDGKTRHVGYYESLEEACKQRLAAEEKYISETKKEKTNTEKIPHMNLTIHEARPIIEALERGEHMNEVAEKFGMSRNTIRKCKQLYDLGIFKFEDNMQNTNIQLENPQEPVVDKIQIKDVNSKEEHLSTWTKIKTFFKKLF